jgi:hypothetical protein
MPLAAMPEGPKTGLWPVGSQLPGKAVSFALAQGAGSGEWGARNAGRPPPGRGEGWQWGFGSGHWSGEWGVGSGRASGRWAGAGAGAPIDPK